MEKMELTHKLAVTAYLYKEGKFLFLLRNTEPKVWAPPSGHLLKNENPEDGILREVKEETNLDVKVVVPVSIWFGEWNGNKLLSIDYYVEVIGGELKLSEEHTDYKWVTTEELSNESPIKLAPCLDLKVKDFEKAENIIRLLQNKKQNL